MGSLAFTLTLSTMASFSLEGYTGFYGRQMALLDKKTASAASAAKYDAAFTATSAKKVTTAVSSTKTVQEKTTTTVEKSTKSKVDLLKEQKTSLEYGKSSKCAALRRAVGRIQDMSLYQEMWMTTFATWWQISTSPPT